MKYAFSTKGWHGRTFDDFCLLAEELKYKGIVLHNVSGSLFTDKDSAFNKYTAQNTLRTLYDKKLSIPCIDALSDIADASAFKKATEEVEKCLEIALNLRIPYIKVRAKNSDDKEKSIENVIKFIENVLPKTKKSGVTILIETAGLFCDTSMLREVLDRFATDYLAALWKFVGGIFRIRRRT
ncbi:MAG: TIM barrel protein [Monoglobales bacterium]